MVFHAQFKRTYHSKAECSGIVRDTVAAVDGVALDDIEHVTKSAAAGGGSHVSAITVEFTVTTNRLPVEEIRRRLNTEFRSQSENRTIHHMGKVGPLDQ